MTWKQLVWKLLMVFFLPAIIYGIIYAFLSIVGIKIIPALFESLILETLALVTVIYVFHFNRPEVFKQLSTQVFSLKKALLLIPLSILVRIPTALIFLIFAFFNLFPGLSKSFAEGVKFQWSDLAQPTGLGQPADITLAIIITVIITPIMEELIFRGVIFNFLRNRWSITKAVIGTSVIFALVHVYVGLFIGSFILGLALTWVYYKWGNIKYSMFLHAFINLFPFIIGAFAK